MKRTIFLFSISTAICFASCNEQILQAELEEAEKEANETMVNNSGFLAIDSEQDPVMVNFVKEYNNSMDRKTEVDSAISTDALKRAVVGVETKIRELELSGERTPIEVGVQNQQ